MGRDGFEVKVGQEGGGEGILAPSGVEGDSGIPRLSNSPTFRAALSHYFHFKEAHHNCGTEMSRGRYGG